MSRAATADRDTDAMRWKLELTGTSATQTRELEAAVDDIGWTRLATRTESKLGLTRVYIATDRGESPEHIATELAERMATRLPTIKRGEPTTWAKVRRQLHHAREARAAYSRSRAVLPPG
jgi:hypothetical protein